MKKYTLLTLFLFCSFMVLAQSEAQTVYMAFKQNENWLLTVKGLNKTDQLEKIRQRFFSAQNQNMPYDTVSYCPMFVVNGVPLKVRDYLTDKETLKVSEILNVNSIKTVEIILNASALFHRPSGGVILFSVDKKTSRKFHRIFR